MHDLRYAFRLIRQNWGFSLTVIAILALCIGANTAVLAVVDGAMLRPLPYPQPDRLAQVIARFPEEGTADNFDGTTWEAIRDHIPSLESVVYSHGSGGINFGVNGSGLYLKQQRVGAGFFHALGVSPFIGREFNADEDRAGGPPAVILSHALWQKYLHGDPGVVGQAILLRGEPYTVVGIMPPASVPTPLRTFGRRFDHRAPARGAGRITKSWRGSSRAPPGRRLRRNSQCSPRI